MEILIGILVFILAVVFIVSLVANSIDKPKVAGIKGALDYYEKGTSLTLYQLPGLPDLGTLVAEVNEELDNESKFVDKKSKRVNAYGNPYKIEVDRDGDQTAVIIETEGKKEDDKYRAVIVKEGGTIEACTVGFGRNDKGLVTLASPWCDGVGEVGGEEEPPFDHVTEVPDGCIEVRTDEDLNNVRNDMYGCYIVMNPIDLTNSDYNQGAVWNPIGGNDSEPFQGIFDGNGYEIKGLRVNSNEQYVGLFGLVIMAELRNIVLNDVHIESGGQFVGTVAGAMPVGKEIKNIGITNAEVVGGQETGGAFGMVMESETEGIRMNGVKVSGGRYAGGAFGMTNSGAKHFRLKNVEVTGERNTGGVIGYVNGGASITDVEIETAKVQGEGDYVGGVIGFITGRIADAKVKGTTINGGQHVGGLVGFTTYYGSDEVISSVDVQAKIVSPEGKEVGGIGGNVQSDGMGVQDATANVEIDVSGSALGDVVSVGGLIGASSVDVVNSHAKGKILSTKGTAVGGLVGTMNTAPNGVSASSTVVDIVATMEGNSGYVTVGGLIGANRSDVIDSHAKGKITTENFNSVGGLVGEDYSGNKGVQKSSTDVAIDVKVNENLDYVNVGGLTGVSHIGIAESSAKGTIKGGFGASLQGTVYVGGLSGRLHGSYGDGEKLSANVAIDANFTTNNITGHVGGLIGETSADIKESYATGEVVTVNAVDTGGLIGLLNSPLLENSYTTGKISATGGNVGGLIGTGGMGNNIRTSYTAREMTVTGGTVGEVVGEAVMVSGNLGSVYYDVGKTGQHGGSKGVSKSTNDMMAKSTYVGWDFDNVWKIDEGKGYPTLRK